MAQRNGRKDFSMCQKCGERILWIQMKSGKKMPVNPEFVNFRKGSGKDRIVLPNGEVVAGKIVTDPREADGYGYVSHFATCEHTQRFRRK